MCPRAGSLYLGPPRHHATRRRADAGTDAGSAVPLSRPRGWRDEAAAGLVARHAEHLDLRGPALVLLDPRPDVREALAGLGLRADAWHRRARSGVVASAWPGGGPYGTAALRLPRAKEELDMMVHAAAGLLDRDGTLLVYGAKDEGAASAGRRLSALFGSVRTVATGGRCRLLEAREVREGVELRDGLAAWRESFRPDLEGLPEAWASFPGVFAHGRLDEGTKLLAEALSPRLRRLPQGSRVLDFGCGHGVLGGLVRALSPSAKVDLLDVDAVALEAARENVPGAGLLLGDGWAAAGERRYDLVVSNPPYHVGKEESRAVVEGLVEGCRRGLAQGGGLAVVVQRRLPVEGTLTSVFSRVEAVEDRGAFRVWWGGLSDAC